jgi:catechol 2,3-dioxygenase-like lactoylglutathione lyase family enzyme
MIERLDNIGIVVGDLEAAKAFFLELGLEFEGAALVDGPAPAQLTGLNGASADVVMMRTPDGHSRLELTSFRTPAAVRAEPADAPANALGLRRLMFAVTDIEDVIARLRPHGAELVGELTQYEDSYKLCYLRGPDGIIVALAERLG